ncbi:peptide chain release factor N(5)-glutamine methyltransferase [Leptospira santarosai]|uniref:Release factor glutamine methyltransferase n=1 Tax=Leptospira santarosai serovar Arenal str. MAVJ 401 TaxID=1049976 RepID=M6JNH8_9LEPT|nr:peptide chain release factor N(5)-glutamine methyltransferase [Leptospira santarosai]EMN23276.1 protein-(glutamine-N5) methyltransferase, release factor-specific [Leptospira santarosai serovar Arenal str. MAVJ 401]
MQHPDSILTLLKKSEEFLKKKEIPSARLDAEILLADLLNLQRVKLYVNFERLLTETEKSAYRERIVDRSKNKPTAYITGRKAFYNSVFSVNEKVLIPRPETEELVEKVLLDFKGNNREQNVLDLCTGSGCIGISLKSERKDWNVTLSDISKDALEIAEKNAAQIVGEGNNIQFLESDLFASIPKESKFDLIVANPPYIPVSDKTQMMRDVIDYEPHLALFLEDPKELLFKLIEDARSYLNEDGKFYMETHPSLAWTFASESITNGWKAGKVEKDLSGKDRFVVLTK